MNSFFKFCPVCNSKMEYKHKYALNYSIKHDKACRSCSAKKAAKENPNRGWAKINEEVKLGKRLNGFANKKHSDETKLKISRADKSYTKTDEFKKKISNATSGKNNPMYGKTVYDIWVEKYDKEMADIKQSELKLKLSKAASGKNNPMYGKPSPSGSGNGWSGWYKGWFFRSILELSYMINVIERFNLKWKNGESNQYKIKYVDLNGTDRTYRPDFIIEDKYMVEIKPKRLQDSKKVSIKKEAATKWCNLNGLVYKITSCIILTDNEIKELIQNNTVELTNRYKLKYNEQFKQK